MLQKLKKFTSFANRLLRISLNIFLMGIILAVLLLGRMKLLNS